MTPDDEDRGLVPAAHAHTLAVSGLADQVELLAFASTLEARPEIVEIALVRAEGAVGIFNVVAQSREDLLAACRSVEGFSVAPGNDDTYGDVLEVTVQRAGAAWASLPAPRAEALARLERRGPAPLFAVDDAPRHRPRLRIFGRGRLPPEVPPEPAAQPVAEPDAEALAVSVAPPEPQAAPPTPLAEARAIPEDAPRDDGGPPPASETPNATEPLPLPVPEWSREPAPAATRIVVGAPERDLVRADARPGGAAPLREHLMLVVYPFRSFEKVNEFQDQLATLEGVINLKVGRFYRGALQLKVEYEGIIPLTRRLRELKEFTPIAMNQPDSQTIEITLEG